MSAKPKTLISPAKLSARVAAMGRAITRDFAGKRLDVVMILENAFLFGADLVRRIDVPLACHFVRAEMRDVKLAGFERREVFFSHEPNLTGRDVLVVDAVLHSGVTLDFLLKRLQQGNPRTLRVAVLIDRPQEHKVDLRPDYVGFENASNGVVGYGLADSRGEYRNLPYVGALDGARPAARQGAGRKAKRTARKKAGR